MKRVEGKVALVTGGARGMGETHVRLLVAEGAKVVLGDILDDEGRALAATLGPSASYIHLDVTREDDWDAAVSHCVKTYGGLHVLVNNAGIANKFSIVDYPIDKWQQMLDVNLIGTFLGIRAAVPEMLKGRGGSIINISSVDGIHATAQMHGYVASKFAVRGLTKSVALELAPKGIRVNSIHPGLIDTPMTAGHNAERLGVPVGRAARPEEVSTLVLFLASDESSYCTAAEFVADGGLIAGIKSARD